MTPDELLKTATAMPLASPGYAPSGTRFTDRETFQIHYRTERKAVERWVPEPLKVVDPIVRFEVVKMGSASGCGIFHESGQMIEVELDGARGNLVHMLFLNSEAAILAGREVFGFPKKFGNPMLEVDGDALLGTLDVGKVRVATATMGYKYETSDSDQVLSETEETKTFLLKMLPHVDASLRVCELVQCSTVNVVMKGAWTGPGDVDFTPHALAPLTALPVVEVIKATHTIMDMSYGGAKVAHDYLA